MAMKVKLSASACMERFRATLARAKEKKAWNGIPRYSVFTPAKTSELNSMIWDHVSDIFPNSKKSVNLPLKKFHQKICGMH